MAFYCRPTVVLYMFYISNVLVFVFFLQVDYFINNFQILINDSSVFTFSL